MRFLLGAVLLVAGCDSEVTTEGGGQAVISSVSGTGGRSLVGKEIVSTFKPCDNALEAPSVGRLLMGRFAPRFPWRQLDAFAYSLKDGDGCVLAPHHIEVFAGERSLDVPSPGSNPVLSLWVTPRSAGEQKVQLPRSLWPADAVAWVAVEAVEGLCVRACAGSEARSYRSELPWAQPPPSWWGWSPLNEDLQFKLTAITDDAPH